MTKQRLFFIIRITAICLLIAAALYFIPFPTEVAAEFHGAVITADGKVLKSVDIRVYGWEHNYLFREDLMQLLISTSSDDWIFATPASALSPRDLYIDVPYMSFSTAIASGTDSSFGWYALSMEDGYFIAACSKDHSRFLIGSTDVNTESTTILAYFSDWIEFYFPAE